MGNITADPRVIAFDDDGDLRLEVGPNTDKQTFLVCSKALARVSNPFKAMLYGGFAEGKPQNEDSNWTVALPEDDPEAFATILNIIHNKYAMVREMVTRTQLFHIAVLTDKYDMTGVLRPWAQRWVDRFALDLPRAFYPGDEELLWIAWTLGHRRLFECVLVLLQNVCKLSSNGSLCCPDGTALETNVYIRNLGILGE